MKHKNELNLITKCMINTNKWNEVNEWLFVMIIIWMNFACMPVCYQIEFENLENKKTNHENCTKFLNFIFFGKANQWLFKKQIKNENSECLKIIIIRNELEKLKTK